MNMVNVNNIRGFHLKYNKEDVDGSQEDNVYDDHRKDLSQDKFIEIPVILKEQELQNF